MFSCLNNKGVHITFANGYTVSLQWGTMNHCEKKSMAYQTDDWKSRDCEIAAFDNLGNMLKLGENEEVIGWQTPEQALAIMNDIASRKPIGASE